MIDFKKLNEERINKLTPEEREFEDKFKTLTAENTLYTTVAVLENRYMNVHRGKEIKYSTIPVKVYRPVYRHSNTDIQVSKDILLSFTPPMEYILDQDFIDNWEKHGWTELCIDAGQELFIPENEMKRIIKDIVALNLPLSEK